MVEVIINGEPIDIISKGVKYTKQVNDFADISTVNTSYTYSLRVDKTPKNTKIFQQLGMVGDTSEFPYVKNVTQLIDNGAMLISRGIATVKETNDEYKLHIQDGIIEVFKLIENKTIGKDLDLSELEHNTDQTTIIASWDLTKPYVYIVADYGGRINVLDTSDEIDGAYLLPSANVKYLFDKVFEEIGYTYSGNFSIDQFYITYPKGNVADTSDLVFKANSNPYIQNPDGSYQFAPWPINTNVGDYRFWQPSSTPIDGLTVLNDWQIRVDVQGTYKIKIDSSGSMAWWKGAGQSGDEYTDFKIKIKINGSSANVGFVKSSGGPHEKDLGQLNIGDIIELEIDNFTKSELSAMGFDLTSISFPYRLKLSELTSEINRFSLGDYDFQQAFGSFKIKDFLKEVMFRESLTPFVDNNSRHIDFVSLSDRLNANTIDWSGKYIKRTNEIYVFDDYAQKNILKLKYNNEDNDFNDGAILLFNEHLKDEKTLFQSIFYSPERLPTEIKFSPNVNPDLFPLLKMWEKEIKEEDDGSGNTVQIIEYKGLKNRFHYIGLKNNPNEIVINGVANTSFICADISNVLWQKIVQNKYIEIDKIFTDTRIHEIELALSANEFATLDLRKLYYFDQEKQFYILNKIRWESGKPAKGEFLRVKNI
ncbi:MAG TPA: hypothetical protein VFM82_03535 [Flavobacteriaceae bacterium]|nr:hypothetical protein [Flavobacteriaceae bacterium]